LLYYFNEKYNTKLSLHRKADNKMPSPLGKGQADMPINCLNQGEIQNQPLSRLPHGGEAMCSSQDIDLEN